MTKINELLERVAHKRVDTLNLIGDDEESFTEEDRDALVAAVMELHEQLAFACRRLEELASCEGDDLFEDLSDVAEIANAALRHIRAVAVKEENE